MYFLCWGDILKIVIKNDEPIRLYHHPREVSVLPKSKLVKTFNEDGSLLETFKLIEKETSWCEDFDSDQSEILVTLHVEDRL